MNNEELQASNANLRYLLSEMVKATDLYIASLVAKDTLVLSKLQRIAELESENEKLWKQWQAELPTDAEVSQ